MKNLTLLLSNMIKSYSLSPIQQGIFFHCLYEEAKELYIQQIIAELKEEIRPNIWQESWQEIVKKYEIFRTSFHWDDQDNIKQIVHQEINFNFQFQDWSNLAEKEQIEQFENFLKGDRQQGFDFQKAPLMRWFLVKLKDSNYKMLWTFHHILLDGRSFTLILKEVFGLYEAKLKGENININEAISYEKYINWLGKQDINKAQNFWQNKLANFSSPTTLNIPKYSNDKNKEKETESLILSQELTEKLKEFVKENDLTLNTLIQGAWSLLLNRYTGTEDVVFGAVRACHHTVEKAELMIGLLVNTLPVRIIINPEEKVISWLKSIRQNWLAMRDFEYTPLVKIQEWSNFPSNILLFESLLVFENYQLNEYLQQQGNNWKNREFSLREKSNYPLNLGVYNGKQLLLKIGYATEKFDQFMVLKMLGHLETLLTEMVHKPQEKIGKLSILTLAEKQQILIDWNNTKTDYPKDKCIHQLFEEQVIKTPNNIALVFEDQQLTYQELNEKANQLAHYLRKLGVKPETLVGICVERSLEMIIGVLGILKARGAYVPLDPTYPQERLQFMLEDSQVSILLTQEKVANLLQIEPEKMVKLDTDWQLINQEKSDNLVNLVESKNLAYIIYTSGSTGKPKGVQIINSNVVNLLKDIANKLEFTFQDSLFSIATLSFDISVAEIFIPLITGGKLIITTDEGVKDGYKLLKLIDTYKPSLIDGGPATWKLLETVNWQGDHQTKVISTAEKLPNNLAKYLLKNNKSVWNLYGPTETTIWSLFYQVSNYQQILIGRPLSNTQIYILDNYLQPVPIAVKGEIYIGGDGVARGYLNRPELTAEKFIPNPFGEGKLYKTGDLARYLPDGNIEFIGRIDDQVKIRGFRIELGEVETFLNQFSQIQETVVMAQENDQGNKYLVAYVITKEKIIVQEIRQFLSEKLPDYMIPAAFVFLDKFPLTPNGKIDKKALPKPDFTANLDHEYIAPRNKLETKLVQIWSQVLGIEKIGIQDNFFELGGNSLLATQIISRIRNNFQIELALRYLFQSPTIAQLAELINNLCWTQLNQISLNNENLEEIEFLQQFKTTNSNLIPVVSREGELPLSFIQERLWFLTKLDQTSASYNMQTTLKITGQLNIIALEKAINFLVQRHESLRTNFINNQGIAQVIIKPEIITPLSIIELKDIQEINTILEEQKSKIFDLEKDNLLHFTLLKITPEEQILMITMHHIISDGWSMELLTRELSELYQSFDENKTPTLKPLPIQYLDFAAWQRNSLTKDTLKNKLKFWQQHLENISPLSTFPTDYPRPQIQTFTGATYKQIINNSLKNKLKNLTKTEEVTLFITLLTAFQVLLYRHTGQEKLVIGYPHHNRTNYQIENLIGFFANTQLVSSNLSENQTFREFLHQVKNFLFQSYEYQDLPFEKLVEELNPERNLSYNPLFQVWFNMLNLESKPLELSGLKVESYSESENNTDVNSIFDLTIYVRENPDYLELNWVYNRDLYSEKTISWLAEQYQVLLLAITENPETQINNLPLIIKEDSEKISSLNQQIIPNSCFQEFLEVEIEQSIPKRFEKIVKNNPQQIAIISNNQELTYKQLNEKANQIASLILELAPSDCQQIGILLGHEYTTIAAILGVLKTGKTYICLDPTYPKSRLKYILKDSQAKIIITNNQNLDLAEELKDNQLLITNIDAVNSNRNYSKDDLNLSISSANIAYILYTSGSTGHPKGVIQNHRNVLHFIRNYTNNLKINSEDKLSLLASLSFDAAIMDIFGALLNGATLCLYDVKSEGLNKLPQWLNEEKITIYHSTPTLYRYVIKELNQESKNQFPYLRLIVLGGEEVVKKDVKLYQEYFSDNCVFINGYGSSESSFNLRYFIHKNSPINQNKIPLGYPFEYTEILLLDDQGNETQIYGEIGVKSEYVALEYWQKPELTNKVFLSDSNDSKKRIYRTGDWGRLRSDGTIEFLGRKDFQVKIRGFRIELGEIETTLNEHPSIKEVIVIANENAQGDKYLVAYLITKEELSVKEIRQFLSKNLPDYMSPATFVFLDKLPLTPNGKIDRISLPKPDFTANLDHEYIAPRNELETKLVQIWSQILGIENIGIKDNFFELGGHSLLTVRLVYKIEKELGYHIPIKALFHLSSIESLAEDLKNFNKNDLKLSLKQIFGEDDPNYPSLTVNEKMGLLASTTTKKRVNNSLLMLEKTGQPQLYKPLFFVYLLGELAENLPDYLPVYHLTAWVKIEKPDTFIKSLATYYVKEIVKIQPEGPYLIGGFCFGGLIALEIAQQLQIQGKEVALLTLIQTRGFNPVYERYQPLINKLGYTLYSKLVMNLRILAELNQEEKKEYLVNKFQKIVNKINQKNNEQTPENNTRLKVNNEQQDKEILSSLSEARKYYQVQSYSGKVALFFAKQGGMYSFIFPQGGWDQLLTGKVSVNLIPGNHTAILKKPFIKKMTQILESKIKENLE